MAYQVPYEKARSLVEALERHPLVPKLGFDKYEFIGAIRDLSLPTDTSSTLNPTKKFYFKFPKPNSLNRRVVQQFRGSHGKEFQLVLRRLLLNRNALEYAISGPKRILAALGSGAGFYCSDCLTRSIRAEKELVEKMATQFKAGNEFSLLAKLVTDFEDEPSIERPILVIPNAGETGWKPVLEWEDSHTVIR